jgi:hypothetical protein
MRLLSILCMLIACASCSTSTDSQLSDSRAELNKVNVISITNEAVNFKASDVFAWQTDILVGGSASNKISDENIRTVKSQVKTFFNQEGYLFTDIFVGCQLLFGGCYSCGRFSSRATP